MAHGSSHQKRWSCHRQDFRFPDGITVEEPPIPGRTCPWWAAGPAEKWAARGCGCDPTRFGAVEGPFDPPRRWGWFVEDVRFWDYHTRIIPDWGIFPLDWRWFRCLITQCLSHLWFKLLRWTCARWVQYIEDSHPKIGFKIPMTHLKAWSIVNDHYYGCLKIRHLTFRVGDLRSKTLEAAKGSDQVWVTPRVIPLYSWVALRGFKCSQQE